MKKSFFSLFLLLGAVIAQAQWQYKPQAKDTTATKQSLENNILQEAPPRYFWGGSIRLSFSDSERSIGLSPLIGYKATHFLDIGLGTNFLYVRGETDLNNGFIASQRAPFSAILLGIAPFVRIFPAASVFLQFQYENTWVNGILKNHNKPPKSFSFNYESLLGSVGFLQPIGNGRTSVYFSIGVDLLTHQYSPYRTKAGSLIPIIATGVSF